MSFLTKVVLDTSVIIDYLKYNSGPFITLNELYIGDEVELLLPAIVVTELFAANSASKKRVRSVIEKAIEGVDVIPFDYFSAIKAGELLRKYKQIPDPYDLLIAAAAIEADAQIATLNKKHFREIKEVQLFEV